MTVDTGNLRRWADAVTGWHESGMTLTTMTVAADLAALSRAAADELEQLRTALVAVPHSTLCAFMTTAYEEPCSCPKSLTLQPESDENAWITHEMSKPTREQIADLLARKYDWGPADEEDHEVADAVLALIQNGAER